MSVARCNSEQDDHLQARRSAPVGTRVLAALIYAQARLEDRAESTSTAWVWRSRSWMSALVNDVRRGSGGEADPGQAPCGRRSGVEGRHWRAARRTRNGRRAAGPFSG